MGGGGGEAGGVAVVVEVAKWEGDAVVGAECECGARAVDYIKEDDNPATCSPRTSTTATGTTTTTTSLCPGTVEAGSDL